MAHLQVQYSAERQEAIPLSRKLPVTIGQHNSNVIVIDDENAAVLEARILYNKRQKAYELSAASQTDISLNGESIRTAILQDGDQFEIGKLKFVFAAHDIADPPAEESALESPQKKEKEVSATVSPDSGKATDKQVDDDALISPQDLEEIKLNRERRDDDPENVADWIRKSRRPGERKATRSPLVTSLTFLAIILFIGVGGLYLMIGRQTARSEYEVAKTARDQRKFTQSIPAYETFLANYPTHPLADKARIELSLSRIDQKMGGAGSDLEEAIAEIENFVEQHRQREDFRDWFSSLASYSQLIAKTAFDRAGRRHDPALLETGERAAQLFTRFKASDGSDKADAEEIAKAERNARAELLQYEVQQASLADMDQAIQVGDVTRTLEIFRDASNRYASFARQDEFLTRIKKILGLEQEGVQTQTVEEITPASGSNNDPTNLLEKLSPQELFLIQHQVNRFDVQSNGQHVWLLSDGNCFAIDRLTGKPVWSSYLGNLVPFEPVDVSTRFECWLVPANDGRSLRLLKRRDGAAVWETALPSRILHRPVVEENAAYLVTEDNGLQVVSLQDGKRIAQVIFPRPLSAPVCVLDDRRLLCVGERDLWYLVDRLDWSCSQVLYYGQAPGSITRSPIAVADRILTIEQDQLRNSRIQILNIDLDNSGFTTEQSVRLSGIESMPPEMRGDRLYLGTTGPKVSAWQLTDQPGEALLKQITEANVPFSPTSPFYLKPTEGDRLLLAGQSLRELVVLANAFEQKAVGLNLGRATQSIQLAGIHAFVAGEQHRERTRSLFHYEYDREETFWKTTVSAAPVTFFAGDESSAPLRTLTVNGQIFDVASETGSELSYSSRTEQLFETNAPLYLSRSTEQGESLAISGRELRRLNARGQTVSASQLPGTSQVPPLFFNETVVWADEAGIHWTNLQSGSTPVDSWRLPRQQDQIDAVRWQELWELGENIFLARDADQELYLVGLREEPQRHLAELNHITLDQPAVGAGQIHNGNYYLVNAASQLMVFDANTLTIENQIPLPAVPTGGPWFLDEICLVETEANQLRGFRLEQNAEQLWEVELKQAPLVTAPAIINENKILICQTGGMIRVLSQDGKLLNSIPLRAEVSCPPLIRSNQAQLGLENGTVITLPLDKLVQKPPAS